jgi:hypothetical protein
MYGKSPSNNAYKGVYTFKCIIADIYDGVPNNYYFTLTVMENKPFVVNGTPNNNKTEVPGNLNMTLKGMVTDPENL